MSDGSDIETCMSSGGTTTCTLAAAQAYRYEIVSVGAISRVHGHYRTLSVAQ